MSLKASTLDEVKQTNYRPDARSPVCKPRDREELQNMMGVERLPEEILPEWEKWMRRYHRCKPGTAAIPVEAKLAFVAHVESLGLLDFTEIDKSRRLRHNEILRLHYNALILVSPSQANHKAKLARFRGTEGNKVLLNYVSRDDRGMEVQEKEQKSVGFDRIQHAQEF